MPPKETVSALDLPPQRDTSSSRSFLSRLFRKQGQARLPHWVILQEPRLRKDAEKRRLLQSSLLQ